MDLTDVAVWISPQQLSVRSDLTLMQLRYAVINLTIQQLKGPRERIARHLGISVRTVYNAARWQVTLPAGKAERWITFDTYDLREIEKGLLRSLLQNRRENYDRIAEQLGLTSRALRDRRKALGLPLTKPSP